MNKGNADSSNSIPGLVSKLCTHFAKDDQELAARLFKCSVNFLTSPNYTSTNNEVDEQNVVSQMRKYVQTTQSAEKAKAFDLLYTRLQKTSVLQNKAQILSFFLNLSAAPAARDLNKMSSMFLELNTNPGSMFSSKSQVNFLPDDPKVGVKKIYQGSLGKRTSSSASNRTHITSQSAWSNGDQDLLKDRCFSASSSRSTISSSITESQLIQEIIYSFQGIEGRAVRKEPGGLGFTVDPKAGKSMTPIQRGLVERLTGVGFLHNQLRLHCDEADKQIGLIGQSLIAILRDELTNYYQLVALLQSQSKKEGCADHSELTLRRMVVWVAEPQLHLQWLAYIAEQCSDKKGGALISAVHGFLQHGATCVQKIAEKVLSAVCRPLYLMLSKWLLDGELNDPCGEFFIEARNINVAERLWHDKYHVRKTMIPSFITLDQANKILATGKSINFLRQICKDTEELPGRDSMQKLFTNTLAEALYTPEQSIELHSALDSVYRETSLRVLDLLKNKYRLLEHLQALRRYLLLGQGDFIRHLLELLAPELAKPAHNLYGHTLSAILESAVRVTNAQYEDEDTLLRLNVGIMENSRDDRGWDVFTLVYLTDGPVGTIFQPTVPTYKCLFGGLWKAKRMEFVLSNMRKQQISSNKLFRNIKEMRQVSHLIHILSNEMIHFLHQTQYYFLFEVLECSWAEMLRHVNNAVCLDDVITAHNTFLTSVQCGVLLDTGSDKLRMQMGLIFNIILSLEALQENLYVAALKEKQSRNEYSKLCESTEGFGVTKDTELENKERKAIFVQFLSTVKMQVQVSTVQFREYVVKYVTLLASSSDMNLQLLSTRLNFNDYYKIA